MENYKSEEKIHRFEEFNLSGTYSYADYLNWEINERLELSRKESCSKYMLNESGKFLPSKVLTRGDEVTSPVLAGFSLILDGVFRDQLKLI